MKLFIALLCFSCSVKGLEGSLFGNPVSSASVVDLGHTMPLVDANEHFMDHVASEVNKVASDLHIMKKDMAEADQGMKEIKDAAAKAVDGKVKLSSEGVQQAANAISTVEDTEHLVDKDGKVSVDAMDAAVHELEKSGAVPMAEQPKASSQPQTKLAQQSRQASVTLDALKTQSKKMRAGLAKHGEYDLTERMMQQTKSLTAPIGKEAVQVLEQIGKEAAQVMQIEEGGIKFVEQVEGKLKADCDGGGKTGKNSDCDGGGR